MSGHQVEATSQRDYKGLRTITLRCRNCTLSGSITATFELADATVADLMATHWAATGGERT